jgi:DNA-nicking Smr family endonuclease
LDLHGKTAQAAYHALDRFLHAAYADHVRCVEIITGRGSGETGGVIRRELPLWLNLPALRPLVLAAVHPGRVASRTTNEGATRLLLRRAR